MTLGAELRRLRLAQRMTKRALAEKVRISETALNKIERDSIGSPRFFLVADLAGVLGVSLDALVRVVEAPVKERTYVRQTVGEAQ